MSAHEFTDLAAIVTIDFHERDRLHNLTFLIWRDCGFRVTCPSGQKMDIDPLGRDLEATINDMPTGVVHMIHMCSRAFSRVGLQRVNVHRVPRELTTNDQVLAWIQTLQGIIVEIDSPEAVGIPVASPPAGTFVGARRTGKPRSIN